MGFGSYTYSNTYYDAGFGSPYTSSVRDTGFGSPYDINNTQIEVSELKVGDDGAKIELFADWFLYSSVERIGYSNDYQVSFERNGTEVYAIPAFVGHPTGRQGYVYTDLNQTKLIVYVPPLDLGVYSIIIRFNYQNALRTITLNNAFEVIRRNHSLAQYSLRSLLPSHFDTGSKKPEYKTDHVFTNFEALTRSLGEILQNVSGSPLTLSTATWNEGDTTLAVESTLGFPSSGYLFLNDLLLSYTGKTNTSFTGIATVNRRLENVEKKAKVLYYDHPIQ